MKYRPAVRLALRILGIYLLAGSVPDLIQRIAFGIYDRYITPTPGAAWMRQWGYPLIGVIEVAIGLYLVIGGKLLLNWLIPLSRRYCVSCGAELPGVPGGNGSRRFCAECGELATLLASPPEGGR